MSRFQFAWFRRWRKWIALAVVVLVLPIVCIEWHKRHREELILNLILEGKVVVAHTKAVPDWTFKLLGPVGRERLFHVIHRTETVIFPKGQVIQPEAVTRATDAVNRLGSIRAVRLREQQSIEPGVFEALQSWHEVERLYLTNSGVTDEAVSEIATLSTLRELDLDQNPVTADGVRHLAALPNLERLSLVRTNLDSSNALSALKSLPALKEVRLGGLLRITDFELESLEKELPGVTIVVIQPGQTVRQWR